MKMKEIRPLLRLHSTPKTAATGGRVDFFSTEFLDLPPVRT